MGAQVAANYCVCSLCRDNTNYAQICYNFFLLLD